MEPYELEIILHYAMRATDYCDGNFDNPDVKKTIDRFVENGLLGYFEGFVPAYRITEGGRMYVEDLCAVQPPVKKWVRVGKSADAHQIEMWQTRGAK